MIAIFFEADETRGDGVIAHDGLAAEEVLGQRQRLAGSAGLIGIKLIALPDDALADGDVID